MYQTLYRKYRPSAFSEVFGQNHITDILSMEVEAGKLSHAYLFCGSRGTGKTTCAKILAKAANCEHPVNGNPCNECASCKLINEGRALDIVEMDAASNNGVANIRDLIDEIMFLPSQLSKKVYIIDEVHMLSTGAFNALLKTLEEPPEHILFILATTELNKIPPTIVSRCQRFDFKRIKAAVIQERLMQVAVAEGLTLDDRAASMIAHLADGALRDALSLLESCAGKETQITAQTVILALGISPRDKQIELAGAIGAGNSAKAMKLFAELYESIGDVQNFFSDLLSVYRDLLFLNAVCDGTDMLNVTDEEKEELTRVLGFYTLERLIFNVTLIENLQNNLLDMSTNKRAVSEITIIKMCRVEVSSSTEALLSRIGELELKFKNLSSLGIAHAPVDIASDKPDADALPVRPTESIQSAAQDLSRMKEPEHSLQKEKNSESVQPTPCEAVKASGMYSNYGKKKELFGLIAKKDGVLKSMLERSGLFVKDNLLHIEYESFVGAFVTKPESLKLIEDTLKMVSPEISGIVPVIKDKKPGADLGLDGFDE